MNGGQVCGKAFKYRIYPNAEQEELIQKTFGCCRFVYNFFLAEKTEKYKETGKSPLFYQQSRELTELKKKLEWLSEVDATALQSVLKDLNGAFQRFFRRIKQGTKPYGYPRFKTKKASKKAYRCTFCNENIRLSENAIKLPKVGYLKAKISRPIEGRILSATLSQTHSGKYFISISCTDIAPYPENKTGAVVGVDIGIADLAITSDGVKYPNPRYADKAEKRLKRLSRLLSRKTRGSNNERKARMRLAVMYEKIANQRLDYTHKITSGLIDEYDIICLEHLNVKGMTKNHHLAKAIMNVSFYEFRRQLEYKAKWHGKQISLVDTFYPSSQLCSKCGYKNPEVKNLKIRTWTCPQCGEVHDRDVNAAQNILAEGLRKIA